MIQDAELFTIGPDEVVVTFRTDRSSHVSTSVGDYEVTTTGPYHSARITGLEPDTEYPLAVDGAEATALLPGRVTTLVLPAGRQLATIATVNDVHFGEVECGRLGTPEELGPILHELADIGVIFLDLFQVGIASTTEMENRFWREAGSGFTQHVKDRTDLAHVGAFAFSRHKYFRSAGL